MRLPLLATFAAVVALAVTPAPAQRRQPTPEERIDRVERQLRQVQKSVFPKGQPADTAGFTDDPAATQVQANQLSNRLDAIEQQMSQIVRSSEESGNRLATMEAELARLRADQDRRLRAIENGGGPNGGSSNDASGSTGGGSDAADASSDADPVVETDDSTPPVSRPRVETSRSTATLGGAEAAYDVGFRLWEAKKYDSAIAALRRMISAYPDDRRVSWANNLIGRSWLDKGEYRQAAEVLLANYRGNKDGERAADSLYYLGQASMKLGQPTQACKAYAELENSYGSNMRPALRTLLPAARAQAKCR
jgi:TolA-binding protein